MNRLTPAIGGPTIPVVLSVGSAAVPEQQVSVILKILYLNVIKNCAQQPLYMFES